VGVANISSISCPEVSMKAVLFTASLLVLVPSASPCVGQPQGGRCRTDCQSVLPHKRQPVVRRPQAMSIAGLTAEDALGLFWQGYKRYWRGEHGEAWVYFEAATRLIDDARYWYYRALAERALGQSKAAQQSRDRAVELHEEGKPRADRIGLVL